MGNGECFSRGRKRGDRRSASEWEYYRLHSYYTPRVLERVEPFQELAPAAAAAHEWINGQGYHRQLIGEQIPLNGRIRPVPHTYAQLTHQQGAQADASDGLRRLPPRVATSTHES